MEEERGIVWVCGGMDMKGRGRSGGASKERVPLGSQWPFIKKDRHTDRPAAGNRRGFGSRFFGCRGNIYVGACVGMCAPRSTASMLKSREIYFSHCDSDVPSVFKLLHSEPRCSSKRTRDTCLYKRWKWLSLCLSCACVLVSACIRVCSISADLSVSIPWHTPIAVSGGELSGGFVTRRSARFLRPGAPRLINDTCHSVSPCHPGWEAPSWCMAAQAKGNQSVLAAPWEHGLL